MVEQEWLELHKKIPEEKKGKYMRIYAEDDG